MLKIYNIKEKLEYLKEVQTLIHLEWGSPFGTEEELELKVNKKIKKVLDNLDNSYFCMLVLLDDENLIGFISLLETDGEERTDLKPWYGTMYVKKEYRKKGYSKILNDELLKEAKNRNFKRVYLKSYLKNYYEKFGAIYMDKLSNGESLYYIDIK